MQVKFALPVGALLEGLRHIGNGEFVADTEKPIKLGGVPTLFEGVVSEPGSKFEAPIFEPYDDPLAARAYRVVAFAGQVPSLMR